MAGLSLAALRQARRAWHDRLIKLPNVIGTGLGVKRRAGAKIDDSALVVIVDRKLPPSGLVKSGQVPSYVVHGGRRIPTDVIEIGEIRLEFGTPPYFLSDLATKGVVTAFAQAEGMFHIVSCAHCLKGQDGDPHTISSIGIWDPAQKKYIEVGQTVFAVDSPGFGLPGNYGFVDAGLAGLAHPDMVARARAAPPLSLGPTPRRGLGVIGRGPGAPISATIDAVEIDIRGRRTDMLILMTGAGSFPGHSGMLWRAGSGQALGVHTYGAQFLPGGGSRYSLSMAVRRMAKHLQVNLLDPG